MRRQRLDAAHQHVEQALARRLLGHIAAPARQDLAVELLHVRGEDRERRAELGAAVCKREARPRRNVAEADLLEALLAQQRQEGGDDFFAVGSSGRWKCRGAPRRGARTLRFAGHGRLLTDRFRSP